ncbi:hypothetical protein IQ07DRAFT_611376 [Pyrenochaeta sp. DS3sAY3a]|nr:hypothetical protein IQ07DRAFT_611376 [Pyrenochaeta sp. DS3sAY3a]
MSRVSIQQALIGLIPTLNGPLPPELIELALSLLARSRSVAQSLKPDEEIARPYACAQLACERSKKRLNLPAITSRPPCPPRIYKKLYNYLNSALPESSNSREPQTPRKNKEAAPSSTRNTPKTPLSGRTGRSTRKADGVHDIPEWVMPAIRTLVRSFNYPSAAPHIYTGVESILPLLIRMSAATADTPTKRSQRPTTTPSASSTTLTECRILSLIAMIFLYVFTRMKDEDVSPDEYNELREKAVNTLLEVATEGTTTYDDLSSETEQMMPLAQEEGWLQMEWFMNIMPLGGDAMEGVEMDIVGPVASTKKGIKTGGSDYIGLGTMMQDASDYLGERQQEDYLRWKEEIMARVHEIEAA